MGSSQEHLMDESLILYWVALGNVGKENKNLPRRIHDMRTDGKCRRFLVGQTDTNISSLQPATTKPLNNGIHCRQSKGPELTTRTEAKKCRAQLCKPGRVPSTLRWKAKLPRCWKQLKRQSSEKLRESLLLVPFDATTRLEAVGHQTPLKPAQETVRFLTNSLPQWFKM